MEQQKYKWKQHTQIIESLKIPSNKATVSQFYYNFQNILNNVQSLLSPTSCRRQISPSLAHLLHIEKQNNINKIIACVILRLLYIDVPESKIAEVIHKKERKNTIFCMLQALSLELLKEKTCIQADHQAIQNYLDVIRTALNNPEIKSQEQQFVMEREQQKGNTRYQRHLKLSKEHKVTERYLYRQKVELGNREKAKVQSLRMYQNIINGIKKSISLDISRFIIEEVLLTLGSVIYFETILNGYEYTATASLQDKYQKQQSRFRCHAYLSLFQIALVFSQTGYSYNQLTIEISFADRDVTTIEAQFFYKQQVDVGSFISQKFAGKQLSLYISKHIYCLNKQFNIGSGAFGSIFRAEALKIEKTRATGDSQLQIIFQRNQFAIKKLMETQVQYNNKCYKVERNRQKLILTLVRQIKYEEDLKKAMRKLKMQTERELVGINHLVTLQEYFEIPEPGKSEGLMSFLAFQESKSTLGNQELLGRIKKKQRRETIIYQIYQQLFEGLYCLHSDIFNLYPSVVKKYFRAQLKRETDQQQAKIKKGQRCGIYHRDIKAHNIVINYQELDQDNIDNVHVQIIDFGLAGIANFEKYKTNTNCGSQHYMAPEMKRKEKYDQKVDIWSIGVTLFEHLSDGRRLYKSQPKDRLQITKKLIEEEISDLQKIIKCKKWSETVRGCLTIVPENRKSAEEVLSLLNVNKIEFMGNKLEIIEQFTEGKEIVCIKSESMNHQFEKIKFQFQKEEALSQEELDNANIHHFVLSKYLNDFTVPLTEKLPVLFATLTIFVTKQLEFKSCFNIHKYLQKTEVIVTEGVQSKSGTNLRINNNNFFQDPGSRLDKEDKDKRKVQLSQQFQLILEIQNSQIKIGYLILNLHKKYQFRSSQASYYVSGYDISGIKREEKSFIFNRRIYYQKNGQYFPSDCTDELLSSRPQMDINYVGLEVSWLHSGSSDQTAVQQKMSSLLDFIRDCINNSTTIRFMQETNCRQDNQLVVSTSKTIFLLLQVSFQKKEQSTKEDIVKVKLFTKEFKELIKSISLSGIIFNNQKFTLLLKTLLECARNPKCHIPYAIIMDLSFMPFKYQEQQKKRINQLKQEEPFYFEGGEYLLCKMHEFIVRLIDLYWKSRPDVFLGKFLSSMRDQIKAIASELQVLCKERLGTRKMEYFPKQLIKTYNNAEIKNLLSIAKTALTFRSRMKELNTLVQQFSTMFLVLDLIKWLIKKEQGPFVLTGWPIYLNSQQEK